MAWLPDVPLFFSLEEKVFCLYLFSPEEKPIVLGCECQTRVQHLFCICN